MHSQTPVASAWVRIDRHTFWVLNHLLEELLQEENGQLSKRVEELEAKVRKLEDEKSRNSLAVELDTLLHHGKYVLHGPDSTVNFSEFSIEAVITELKQYAPNVYRLFLNTDRCGSSFQFLWKKGKLLFLCVQFSMLNPERFMVYNYC